MKNLITLVLLLAGIAWAGMDHSEIHGQTDHGVIVDHDVGFTADVAVYTLEGPILDPFHLAIYSNHEGAPHTPEVFLATLKPEAIPPDPHLDQREELRKRGAVSEFNRLLV